MLPIAKYTFNNANVGSTAAHGVGIGDWIGFSQDATGVNTVVAESGTNALYTPSPFGLWKQNYNVSTLYTECDFTAVISSEATTATWMSPRSLLDSVVVGSGYGAIIVRDDGDHVQGYVQLYKACGQTPYAHATFYIPTFSSPFRARMTISGLVLSAYINDEFVGDYDFTGAGVCGVDYSSGYIMLGPGFSNAITFNPGDQTPGYTLMDEA